MPQTRIIFTPEHPQYLATHRVYIKRQAICEKSSFVYTRHPHVVDAVHFCHQFRKFVRPFVWVVRPSSARNNILSGFDSNRFDFNLQSIRSCSLLWRQSPVGRLSPADLSSEKRTWTFTVSGHVRAFSRRAPIRPIERLLSRNNDRFLFRVKKFWLLYASFWDDVVLVWCSLSAQSAAVARLPPFGIVLYRSRLLRLIAAFVWKFSKNQSMVL